MSINYFYCLCSEGGEWWISNVPRNLLKHPRSLHATDINYFSRCHWILHICCTVVLDFRQTLFSDTEFMTLLDIMSQGGCIRFLLSDQLSSINTSARNVTQRLEGYFQQPFFKIKRKRVKKSMRI